MAKTNKVPDLRFADFAGEWEEKKLSDLGKISAGGDVDKKKIKNEGNYPVIANGDSNNGIIGYYNDSYKISDPAVTISARGNIGTAVPRNYPFTPVIRVLTLISENNIYFMSEVINRLRIFNESSGVPQLTSPQFGAYKIFITGLNEQEKIGDLFKKIDDLIEIQESKVFKMEDFKKSMLQKMFPKKDELVPEFRFEGYYGEWQSTKLKHIGIVKSGVGFPEKFQGGISGIPFFKVSDMNLDSNNIIMKNAQNYVSEIDIIKNKWNVITDKPAIIFAKVGAAIFLERKRIVTENFLIDNNMMAFIPKVKLDLYFFKVLLDTTRLTKYAQSGALPSYNANDIYSIPIILPSLAEQEKIGQFFKNLDAQIETEKKLLDSYKLMKKSLLQKLFV